MRNFRALLYYIHMTTNNRINGKCPRVPIIQFYILAWFHTQRHFCAILSDRVSNSGQHAKCNINYYMNKPCKKLHLCIPSRSTYHYTLLRNPMIIHTKTLFAPTCHLRKKISSETKLSHYTLLHPQTLHTSSYTSKEDSKIDSIELDNFHLGRIRNTSIKPRLQVGLFSS